jgi:hypothetical protein
MPPAREESEASQMGQASGAGRIREMGVSRQIEGKEPNALPGAQHVCRSSSVFRDVW